jgi:hypothetical protein
MMSLFQSIALLIGILHAGFAFSPPIVNHINCPPTSVRTSTTLSVVSLPQISIDFFNTKQNRSQLKSKILSLASETQRGLTATMSQKEEMDQLFRQLEKLNPTPNPLIPSKNKPSVNGDWDLKYTTSDSILGKGGFPRVGPIVQNIDTVTLSARNSEVVKYGYLINVPRSVTAELSPVNGKVTKVQFKRFMLGPVGFDAPDSFRGSLDITYLDEDMRLTRGDKGNIFVLTRM